MLESFPKILSFLKCLVGNYRNGVFKQYAGIVKVAEQLSHSSLEEISLVDLLLILWKEKWALVIGGFISLVAGISLSMMLPKKYEYQTEIVQAKTEDYGRMYVGKLETWRPESIDVFEDAIDTFKSNELALKALETILPEGVSGEDKVLWLEGQLRDNVTRRIQHTKRTKLNKTETKEGIDYFTNNVQIGYSCTEPTNCRKFLDTWVVLVHNRLVEDEVHRIEQKLSDTINQLKFNHKQMEELYVINVDYYIKVFQEAFDLATALDLKENQHEMNTLDIGEFIRDLKLTNEKQLDPEEVKDGIDNLGLKTPLYFYGTKTLGSIIKSFQKRKTDYSYIEKLNKSKYAMAEWQAVKVVSDDVRFFRTPVQAAPTVVTSMKKVVLVAITFLGLFITLCAVLVRGIVKYRKKKS